MKFGTDTYRAGAFERIEDARLLKDAKRYAGSMYSAGLAVEGMLRSLFWLRDKKFDERHDLKRIATRIEELGLFVFHTRWWPRSQLRGDRRGSRGNLGQ